MSLVGTSVREGQTHGTTYSWAGYLSRNSSVWKEKIGSGLSLAWPVGKGAVGNAGIAAAVTQTTGAIGYVDYTHALQKGLVFGQLQNARGLFVIPSPEAFQVAASTVNWRYFKDFSVSIGDAAGGPDAYPIAATTFVLMDKTPKNAARTAAALSFFKWALEEGDGQVAKLNYVALPPNLIKQVEMHWTSQIKTPAASATN